MEQQMVHSSTAQMRGAVCVQDGTGGLYQFGNGNGNLEDDGNGNINTNLIQTN